MKGITGLSWGIVLLSLLLVPVLVSGEDTSPDLSAEYAEIQSFRSIDNASLALYAGQNALQAGRYEEALGEYTNVTELDPSWMAAWYLKAYSLTKLNRSQEALVAIDKALALDPTDRDSNNLKADILTGLGRGSEAGQYRRTPVAPPEAPSAPVTATTTKKAPIHTLTLIAGVFGIVLTAGAYGNPGLSTPEKGDE
ncbi:MAG: tetratricopeptide repeat protein [Methanoregulaceae archaeon]|nr:tetratricopeptide repeat protein [Methanoregulaceae archaeon]